MTHSITHGRKHRSFGAVTAILSSLFLIIAFLAFFSAKWYVDTYGQLGFDSILYTLLSDLGGVESDLLFNYLRTALLPALMLSILLSLYLFLPCPKKLMLYILPKFRLRLFPVKRFLAYCLCLPLSLGLLYKAAYDVELLEYLDYISHETTIYQDEYRDPATVQITFPEQKRNLIYIFLESMETTFFPEEHGGFLKYSIAPELYHLADSNINFSPGDAFGGLFAANGSGWTMGAMVAQTAGIPLKTPPGLTGNEYGADGIFLPGVTNLTDILRNNGYYQTLMVGSNAAFGGRSTYYSTHGVDHIYDWYTASDDKVITPGYYVWWGFEDHHLFEYAKQELTEIAAKNQPFAFTMLTVDTHHVGGYVCPDCTQEHAYQYENVISCSSKKVAEFVKWIQSQDFYENTTIVVVGDHPTMDNGYIQSIGAQEYDRRVYNCFINSAVQPSKTKNRVACTIDMFPSTLAAMGCTIEGDRLGLGTNLFSSTPTLGEELGLKAFNDELGKESTYYTSNFFFAE